MNSLTLSSPAFDYSALDRANISEGTKIKYKSAIQRLVDAQIDPFNNFTALADYANSLPHSIRAHTKAALAIMVEEYTNILKATAKEGEVSDVQRILWRLEAMDNAIQVQKSKGSKAHTWLSRDQVEEITALPDRTTPRGLRDYIVLATLLGAGLRREELVNLTFEDLRQQPAKNGMRDILSVKGKGDKRRVIPISTVLAHHLREWHKLAGDGYVARSVNKTGAINGSLSAIGVHHIVREYGERIGIHELDSHDLRRTFARLGYDKNVPVEQISKLLGHTQIATTMIYLGIDIDIESTVSDFIPLSGD